MTSTRLRRSPDTTAIIQVALFSLLCRRGLADGAGPPVTLQRVPGGGIQPQAADDETGAIHLLYFTGEAKAGDLHYARSSDGGASFSRPLRVNTHPASAIAVGNIRGAHLALGRSGASSGRTARAHVAWNGSDRAQPRAPGGEWPMLYTRLNDAGTAFEPERNLIQARAGLDGGGSVAADASGNVYVAWHAPDSGARGEGNRRVWVARSTDEGKSFEREEAAWREPTGACGCCGLRAFADPRGPVYILYRSAAEEVHRDMFLLASRDRGKSFQGVKLHEWEVPKCVMSSAAFAASGPGVLAAWETKGQVYAAAIDAAALGRPAPVAAPGERRDRKHPALAVNARGETLLAWTEGMGWDQGGRLAWQVYDKGFQPIAGKGGRADGVPKWSLVAAAARPDGSFVIFY